MNTLFSDRLILPFYMQVPYKPLIVNVERIYNDCKIFVTNTSTSAMKCDAVSFMEILPVPTGLMLHLQYYGAPEDSIVIKHSITASNYATLLAENVR